MDEPPTKKYWFPKTCGWMSLLVAIGIFTCHWFQFDFLAPVTLVPPWMWLVPAVLLTAVTVKRIPRSLLLVGVLMWSVFVVFVEEARSLINRKDQATAISQSIDRVIRIVSLNCNIGNKRAALEVDQFKPNIVLFQESPAADQLRELSAELFGDKAEFIYGGDASIIVEGKLETLTVDHPSHFVHAVATLTSGQRIDVVSLRLSPPVFRLDFWEAGFWDDHRTTRQKHRSQLSAVSDYLAEQQVTSNLIIGGDFNMVGNDGAFSPFEGLSDTFRQAGAGWCNTGTNDYPLFRVDQIWTSTNFSCDVMRAYRTDNSDHRLIVADVELVND